MNRNRILIIIALLLFVPAASLTWLSSAATQGEQTYVLSAGNWGDEQTQAATLHFPAMPFVAYRGFPLEHSLPTAGSLTWF